MEEKRKSFRIEKILMAQYSEGCQEDVCWDSTTIKNISADGMLLHTNKNFVKDQVIILRFKLPFDPSHWVNAKGKVVESYQCKTRILFIELDNDQRKMIQEYVAWFIKNNPLNKR